jgi:general secretion pathway protein G
MRNIKKHGFTFIEILVVATLIGILATIGIVTYSGATARARDGKRQSDIEQIRSALEMYRADNGYYPLTTADLSSVLSDYINSYPSPPDDTTCDDGSTSASDYEDCYTADDGSGGACDNTSGSYCTGYSIGVQLETSSSDYTKENP